MLNLPAKEERLRHFGSVAKQSSVKPTTKETMSDLQNRQSDYYFAIDAVGVTNVRYPIRLEDRQQPVTVATWTLTTSLAREQKGINMSRLLAQLAHFERRYPLTLPTLTTLTTELAIVMEQNAAQLTVTFPWFVERTSPVSQLTALMETEVTYTVATNRPFKTKLVAAVTTLCPCSKEISDYSAHNQRGIVSIEVEHHEPTDVRAVLLEAAESNASSLLYPILKRTDEKYVTEYAYENPRFVEDLLRLIAAELYESAQFTSFTIECRNEESIHAHDAVARLHWCNV